MSIFNQTFTFDTDNEVRMAEIFLHPKPYDAVTLHLDDHHPVLCKSRESFQKALNKYNNLITDIIPENVLLDVMDAE